MTLHDIATILEEKDLPFRVDKGDAIIVRKADTDVRITCDAADADYVKLSIQVAFALPASWHEDKARASIAAIDQRVKVAKSVLLACDGRQAVVSIKAEQFTTVQTFAQFFDMNIIALFRAADLIYDSFSPQE